MKTKLGLLLVATFASILSAFDLLTLKSIQVGENPAWPEKQAAEELNKRLKSLFTIEVPIFLGPVKKSEPAIYLGRQAAIASGLVKETELEPLKYDGYLVRISSSGIAIAGYRARGALYGTYALIEKMGLKIYPGNRSLGTIESFPRVMPTSLAEGTFTSSPFFEYRSLLDYIDRGMLGGSWQDLGNPQEGANQDILGRSAQKNWLPGEWLGSDHTAPYLVPKQLYYDSHPEYFAMSGGKRLPKETLMQRMSLCLSNPEVHRIAAQRMVEWMDIQKDRRFFYCTDADADPCRCSQCLALDYLYYYCPDRYLAWVNSVARAVAKAHPEKRLFAFAYIATVKPPVKERVEPNVIVLYCPWYWTSAGVRYASWAHPRNITAMEEFMGWVMKFPNQMGIYDYPGHGACLWLTGHIERVKWYAKNRVKTIYCCGTPTLFDGLFLYVVGRLNWDPYLDSGKLIEEYMKVAYGQAAGPLLKYLQLDRQLALSGPGHILADEESLRQGRKLLQEAWELAEKETPEVKSKLAFDVLTFLGDRFSYFHPRKQSFFSEQAIREYQQDVVWYINSAHWLMAEALRRKSTWLKNSVEKQLMETLNSLNLEYQEIVEDPAKERKDLPEAERINARFIAHPEKIVEGLEIKAAPPAEQKQVNIVDLSESKDREGWVMESTNQELVSQPVKKTYRNIGGVSVPVIGCSWPLGKLPEYRLPISDKGKKIIHSGSFVLVKKLETPVDISGCDFVEFHVSSSTSVPATFCLDMPDIPGVRSDIHLHPGEQIVRLDLRQHAAGAWGRHKEKWNGTISGIKIEFWPQDNFYPHPQTKDGQFVLLKVSALNYKHQPADLPYPGQVIWLAQYRSNLTYNLPVPREKWRLRPNKTADRDHYEPERFRTFTADRCLTPLRAIVIGPGASPEETRTAENLQQYLKKLFGVTLPINPDGLSVSQDTGNVFLLGKKAALASQKVTEEELKYVGPEGFVIRAHQGVVVVAGSTEKATAYGVARYLEDHGAKFFQPGVKEKLPNLSAGFLHELYLLDWPSLSRENLAGGWQLGCLQDYQPVTTVNEPEVEKLAEAIKEKHAIAPPKEPCPFKAH
ncbi:MAG: DUF4838 domain-containing protein [Candidatus Omnitrophica bacterium]|nr:DUF4838 domain-containing protein [Candidatus Omnitrophota bacterium]